MGEVSSIPAPRLAVRAISASRLAAATLAGLVIVSVVVRTWAASKHAGPAYFPDEYLYTELSRSIATTGHAYVRGAPSHFAPLLAPLVTAPAWLIGNVTTGYHAVQAINATFVSLAAVPVFALARTLRLGRPQALAAAALALVLPGLLYTSFMLSEPIAYPLVLAAVATGVRALDRPSARSIAAFVGFVLLASFARLQFAVLLPCFLVALVGVLAREQRVKATLRRHWRSGAALVLATVALAAAGPARSTGYYPSFLHVGIDVGNLVSSLGLNALILAVGTGLVLLPGAILGAVGADRASAHPRRARLRAPDLDRHDRAAAPGVDLRRHARGADAVHVLPRPAVGSVLSLICRSRLAAAPDPRSRVARPADGRARPLRSRAPRSDRARSTRPSSSRSHGSSRPTTASPARRRTRSSSRSSPGSCSSRVAAWARPKVATIVALAFAAAYMGALSVGAYAFDSANTRRRAADVRRQQSVLGRRPPSGQGAPGTDAERLR